MTNFLKTCFLCHGVWRVFDFMTNFFDVMTSFWSHDEIVGVMTYFWHHDKHSDVIMCFDIMMNFLISWLRFDVITNFWHRETSYVMTNLLVIFFMSWQTFWRRDKLFVVTCFLCHDKLFVIMMYFWRHYVLFYIMADFCLRNNVFSDVITCFWRNNTRLVTQYSLTEDK